MRFDRWRQQKKIGSKKTCVGPWWFCGLRRSGQLLLIVVIFIFLVVLAYEWLIAGGRFIWFGVTIDGVSVGGMTEQAATEKVEQAFRQKYDAPIILQINDATYSFQPWELGLRADFAGAAAKAADLGRHGGLSLRWQERQSEKEIALQAEWHANYFWQAITPLLALYRQEPISALPQAFGWEQQEFTWTQSKAGRYLAGQDCWQALAALSLQDLSGTEPVILSVSSKDWLAYPAEEQLQNWDWQTVIASYTTYYQDGGNRAQNIQQFAGFLNGMMIYPYERFSINEKLGERTEGKGYLPAPMIVEGEHVDAIGGGICQVVSTLYNAIYEANAMTPELFPILERHEHSLPVEYVPEGRDATVAYGVKDFVFTLHGDTPILIQAQAKHGVLTVTLRGKNTKSFS